MITEIKLLNLNNIYHITHIKYNFIKYKYIFFYYKSIDY